MLLGFDPGGSGAFGWCVTENLPRCPLPVRATGVANVAVDAVRDALFHVRKGEDVDAAGIDAPLFWTAGGDRRVDQLGRAAVRHEGGPSSTVIHVNALRGACLIQGVLAGMLLRKRFANIRLTEAHPKAYLWMSGAATPERPPQNIDLVDPPQFQVGGFGHTDHERDAATLSAWAMIHHPPEWSDLFPREATPLSPLAASLAYQMPRNHQIQHASKPARRAARHHDARTSHSVTPGLSGRPCSDG